MRVLVDTHVFLWFIEDSPQLSLTAKALIEDGANEILLSVGSLWEMAIKASLSKLQLGGPFGPYVAEQLRVNSIELLDITLEHAAAVAALPLHHRDPFDRLLVAQALVEAIPLVSADTLLDAYPVSRVW